MKYIEDKRFYVYIYMDPTQKNETRIDNFVFDYIPFYIGKGKEDRYLSHIKDAQNTDGQAPRLIRIRELKKQNLDPVIVILVSSLSQNKAFELEKQLIKKIGRADKKLGPLLNCTDGGQGQVNRKFTDLHRKKISETRILRQIRHTKETLEKISKKKTGQKLSIQARKNISIGLTKRDPEVQNRFVFSRKDKKNSKEHNKKISNKHARDWKIFYDYNKFIIIHNLKQWCKDNNVFYCTNYQGINLRQNIYRIEKLNKLTGDLK